MRRPPAGGRRSPAAFRAAAQLLRNRQLWPPRNGAAAAQCPARANFEAAAALARRIGVPPNRLSEIAASRRAITGDTALRLDAVFGTTAEFWMNLQKDYELAVAREGFEAEIDRVA